MAFESAILFESVERIYERVFQELRPALAAPRVEIQFRRFTSVSSRVRFSGGVLEVRISDLLEHAPAPVQESLAYILLSKLFRQAVPARMLNQYKLYLRRPEMQRRIDDTRRERGAKRVTAPEGRRHNLKDVFDRMNARYFGGALDRPLLGWSRVPSRRVLGHYDAAHRSIVLSPILDRPGVPDFLVDYVMFHEMLHIKHPVETRGARRRIHPRSFRDEEKTFERFAEVKAALRALC
jgi:hypothetical protein